MAKKISTEEITAKLLSQPKPKPASNGGLSSGSTLTNLAMTGDPEWAFDKGCGYLLVGGSGSGKTWLCLNAAAEATIDPAFKDYRIIYVAPEHGARMKISKFFGSRLEERMEWRSTKTVEEFYFDMDEDFKDGRPFIKILDSESALSSLAAEAKFQERKAAFGKGKKIAGKGREVSGSMGDGKAGIHSGHFRVTINKLPDNGSILLMIAQSRMNIGPAAMFTPETRPGGTALTFYATTEMWFKTCKRIKRNINNKDRVIGKELSLRVKKNRDTGREPEVILHHYFSIGIDDTGSMVQYLVDEKVWKSSKEDGTGKIEGVLDGIELVGNREKISQRIETEDLEGKLKDLVVATWNDIEEQCRIVRKPRYGQS